LLDRLRERPRPRRALVENAQQSDLHALPPAMSGSKVSAIETTSMTKELASPIRLVAKTVADIYLSPRR